MWYDDGTCGMMVDISGRVVVRCDMTGDWCGMYGDRCYVVVDR